MFHRSAVSVELLDLLGRLQEPTRDHGFALAGGTSLALRFGHRMSADLDFFTEREFDPRAWAAQIGVGPESITGMAVGTLQLSMDGIKVEFLRHAYPKLAADEEIGGIRLWALADVAAMKLNAIANRGSKKDFYDIAVMLGQFPLASMLCHYREKYRPASLLMAIRSLAWFEDAEAEPDPVGLGGMNWLQVKEVVSRSVRELR